ncbi:thioredoxin family protein [Methylomonas sp. SURF-2]|uniref:Thioredoxin family protein n=1 Tax=Methylomonas subterranea TaxID=2952225 RepID=A0ABT1TLR7_9GAMM|nr:thioredoxin family protein [Methylomonas sp. SURF-2]MCQ8106052.1 thioredoxin family protein [Methylomonas sp. SURF-2]
MGAMTSNMLPLGTPAPDFSLPDTVSGQQMSLRELKGQRGTLVMFICNHCPYVLHVKAELIAIARHYAELGVSTIAISANDIQNYPQDAPDKMRALMAEWGNPFAAYLYDESQTVARAYQAACTPDIYLFDADLSCVYRGRLDGSTPKNDVPLTGEDLRQALDDLLAGRPLNREQLPSIGCNIKWKPEDV